MAEGREGDWECGGCKNRNYAFRSFCNRCRQPRLLVDTNTPSDSKWLPRIGDWICTGCTNNNYASRDKCKKCGHTKAAAIPAVGFVMPSGTTSLPAYFRPRGRGGGVMMGNQPPLAMHAVNWGAGADNRYGGGGMTGILNNAELIVPYANEIPKGFRSGDWICGCGFHNYQSRTQCKKCNASPPALGIKRVVPEEFVHDWDNKRLNLGHAIGHQQFYPGFEQEIGARGNPIAAPYDPYHGVNSILTPNLQLPMALPQHAPAPTLLGKGAKQWRNGDWMCSNCDNHNYASRLSCNRCKTERDAAAQPVNVM